MPRKKQAQPKHCQEEVDNLLSTEDNKGEDDGSTETEEVTDVHLNSNDDLQNSECLEDSTLNDDLPMRQNCPMELDDQDKDKEDKINRDAIGQEVAEGSWTDRSPAEPQTSSKENQVFQKWKSPDSKSHVLLPELVHPIKKELLDVESESNSYDESPDKRGPMADILTLAGERQLFNHYFQHYNENKRLRKNTNETEDEEEDKEFKYRPPSSQKPVARQTEGDDVSNGFSSPRSKVASPFRPRSNSSERSSNATGFRSQRSSSSISSGSSRTATSPSYTAESHVNRLQSFVESLTTPIATVRNKMTKEGRHFIQSPSLTAKAPSCRENSRNCECCTSKTSLVNSLRGSYINSTTSRSYGRGESTEEQPLDLSLKKYQQRGGRGAYEGDEGISGSASLLTLQSKFGENSPMLSSSTSKFHGVNFYNGLGYGFFKQSMYDTLKQKSGFSQGSSNGFEARSPSLSSSSSSKPTTNEISSLKQMVGSCETGRPSSQTKSSTCCDSSKLPAKRPRSGNSERNSESFVDKNLNMSQLPLTSQSSQQSSDAKKAKPSSQDRRFEKLQKKKMQNFVASLRPEGNLANDSSLTSSEANQNVGDKKKIHTNQRCSCGVTYSNLFQLTVHVEETGHTPESLELDTAEDLPKLVRGQDVWISQGQEQTEMILRCIQCRTSFRSLPELTVHMVKTKHYINIVKADGDFSEPNNRTWVPKPGSEQQKPSSSLSTPRTPTATHTGNASTNTFDGNNGNNNNNNSPTSFKSGSQADKKLSEINQKSKNKMSDNENSSDKAKSDGKALKFGITEMLDFPSYKKMLKKMTENCEEIKPVDGVALTLFHNRLDQERMTKQHVRGDSRHQSNHSSRSYPEESSLRKVDSRSGNGSASKSSQSKAYQQESTDSTPSSCLSGKYITPKFSYSAAGKNLSSNDESEPVESKTSNAERKSMELVSPLPYGVDGASSLKAMENFIESSFSKISQSLHTPSSLPFPSFASRCLITAPVLENVYNNAFLRCDARMNVRNANNNNNNNLNCNKSDGKKRPLDQCQSSSTNEDLLRKRKKLQSTHGLMSNSQSGSSLSLVKKESTPGDERLENRFTISSESSSTTDSEYARQYQSLEKNQYLSVKDEKVDECRAEERLLNPFDLTCDKYLSGFSSDRGCKSSTPSNQTSYSNSLDSIKMLASKFFSSQSPTFQQQQPSTPTRYNNNNRKRDFYSDSYRGMEYVGRQALMSNPHVEDNLANYSNHHQHHQHHQHHHHHGFEQTTHFDEDPPNLIRIKPEPQDEEEKKEDEGGNNNNNLTPHTENHRQQQPQQQPQRPQIGKHDDIANGLNSEINSRMDDDAEADKEDARNVDQEEDAEKKKQRNEDEAAGNSSLHLSRCQPTNFPMNESLSTTVVRSCQQVQ